jgi:hypothetical protein
MGNGRMNQPLSYILETQNIDYQFNIRNMHESLHKNKNG